MIVGVVAVFGGPRGYDRNSVANTTEGMLLKSVGEDAQQQDSDRDEESVRMHTHKITQNTHTHTQTFKHSQTHTHTHTHTHTQMKSKLVKCLATCVITK
jgi:hypothetical protein